MRYIVLLSIAVWITVNIIVQLCDLCFCKEQRGNCHCNFTEYHNFLMLGHEEESPSMATNAFENAFHVQIVT